MTEGIVSISRRIEAPAGQLFALLADPANHALIDGSGMVRQPVTAGTLSGAGDTFRMDMHHHEWGAYQMHNEVVEFKDGELLAWQPARPEVIDGQEELRTAKYRWGFELVADGPSATIVTETFDCTRSPDDLREATENGEGWRDSITASLAKLEQLARATATA